ncbi:hypothetical protein BDB01DRAFT_771292 [Pilobolus umbonatus]|nr:hypothetical protein BDB01DRAFT_771292 [Pilobolus umbonatus]
MNKNTVPIENVIYGSAAAGLAGGAIGATMGVLKNAPVKQYSISTGINCGIFGATFFIVRESFLGYQRSKNPQFGLKDSQTKDFDTMFSSAMAGATTGGLLSAISRGSKSVPSSAILFGALCTGLQAVYNTGNNWRQESILKSGDLDGRYVLSKEKKESEGFSILKHIHMPSWFPIHQISEEEYEELLDTRLQTLEAELAELERKLRESEKKK